MGSEGQVCYSKEQQTAGIVAHAASGPIIYKKGDPYSGMATITLTCNDGSEYASTSRWQPGLNHIGPNRGFWVWVNRQTGSEWLGGRIGHISFSGSASSGMYRPWIQLDTEKAGGGDFEILIYGTTRFGANPYVSIKAEQEGATTLEGVYPLTDGPNGALGEVLRVNISFSGDGKISSMSGTVLDGPATDWNW